MSYLQQEAPTGSDPKAYQQHNSLNNAKSCEPTIREYLHSQIIKHEYAARTVRDLLQHLPEAYLSSGVSRLGVELKAK